MLKHYILTTLRILNRNRLYSLLNIVGLATGLAACVIILQYVRFERSYEDMHELADRIYRVSMDYYEGETVTDQDAMTYIPVGPRIVREIPEVIDFARFQHLDPQEITINEKVYREKNVYLATASCLNVFSYTFIEGDPNIALEGPYQVLLSQTIAKKFFGAESAIGKILSLNFRNRPINLTVVGVMEDLPLNTHLKFDMLISYETVFALFEGDDEAWDYKKDNWNSNNDYTYILLDEANDFDSFEKKLAVLNTQILEEELLEDEKIIAQSVKDIHLYSHKPFEAEPNGDAQSVQFLQLIAFFILIMAIVNYINMATARAMERAKEVGIRKTIGSKRQQLMRQFLFETAFIHFLAGLLAISIVQAFQPTFEYVTGIPRYGLFITDVVFWFQLIGLLLLSTLLSGLYPAWILSAYQPILMLKGNFIQSGKGRLLRKGLIVAQFSISLLLIVGLGVFRSQLIFMKNKDLGTNIEQTLILSAPSLDSLQNNFPSFKNELLQSPDIQSISVSSVVPGNSLLEMSSTTGISLHGAQQRNNLAFYMIWIDETFLAQMEVNVLAGNNFDQGTRGRQIIVNERAIQEWEINSPSEAIGQQVDYWGNTWTIRGVIENYHQRSVKEPFMPIIMMYSDGFWGFSSMKLATNNLSNVLSDVETSWQTHFMGSAISYFFLDENFSRQYATDQRFLQVFSFLTFLAILIAALGLIGLASYLALKRTKEIGIRKVLGATIPQIWALLSKDFFKLMGVAILISLPLSWVGIRAWLSNYPFRTELDWFVFIIPVVLLFLLATLSISFQILKSARVNPIESLKYE